MIAQQNRAQNQYRGCLGSREGSMADRLVTRRANWGPRAVWNRLLARLSSYWQWVLAILIGVALIWWGNEAFNVDSEQASEETIEPEAVAAEEILQGAVLDSVLELVESTPEDQMMAALYRSEAAGDALARHYYVYSPDVQVQQQALRVVAEVARRNWPDDYRGKFLASLLPSVLSTARTYQVPPSVTLGQAILESGWGRSGLSTKHYNLFGVKAGSSSKRVEVPTLEHSGTGVFMTRAAFRKYDSYEKSIKGHALTLHESPRYAHARPKWKDWRAFIKAIAPRYASHPGYAARVTSIIEHYGLDHWDSMIVAASEQDQ